MAVTARKRGSTWEYRFECARVGGKRKQVSRGGYKTKKEAVEAGTKAYNEYMNSGQTFTPTEISVSGFLVHKNCFHDSERKYSNWIQKNHRKQTET